jgi:methyl-accepting chemotaxis protein
MNSAIEAAHAGEYGRGFAVVADEIRKLAESSNEQSQRIAGIIGELREAVSSVTTISESTGDSFAAIENSVRTVTDIEQEIKNSIEEQAGGSTQLLATLSEINRVTTQVHSGSASMLEGGKAILDEIGELAEVSGHVKESATE